MVTIRHVIDTYIEFVCPIVGQFPCTICIPTIVPEVFDYSYREQQISILWSLASTYSAYTSDFTNFTEPIRKTSSKARVRLNTDLHNLHRAEGIVGDNLGRSRSTS